MAGVAAHQTAGHAGEDSAEWRVAVPAAAGAEHENTTKNSRRAAVPAAAGAEHENTTKNSRRCCTPAALLMCLFSWAVALMHRMAGVAATACLWLLSAAATARDRVAGFAWMAWKIGADDPRKVAHGFKMALALTLCSLFYYVQPLYFFAGNNNAMWAVLTVVVVFEYTVGGCLYKGLNRAMATVTGAALALGVHWIASKSDKEFQPFILSASLFVFAAAATYSRFMPTMKARFDYGVTIFILTYTLIAVGGYRVDEVVFMARHRLTTIAIGAMICFAVCALIFPVWAGRELHDQVVRNMDNLAAAVESCIDDYFSETAVAGVDAVSKRALSAKSQGYRAVLNAKASEDSLANMARWEPPHGNFGFRHPYHLYGKVGAAMRSCAYCVDALAACVVSEAQTPAHVKKCLAGASAALSRHCAAVLREASCSVASMTRSGHLTLAMGDMGTAAQELRNELRCLAPLLEEDDESTADDAEHEQTMNITTTPPAAPLVEALPLFTAASLLLEICARAEGVVSAVDALATTARFKKAEHEEEVTQDVEAAVPAAMGTTTITTADVPQEMQIEMRTETTIDQSSDQTPRDQADELIKVLMRRRSTKKWARGDSKVCPKPPQDFVVHAPSPRSRSMELPGHAQVASPSPRHWSVELAGHPPVAPSPRNRSVDFASHGSVLPSPRNRSMDFAIHGPVLPSPRHRSILGMA